MRYGEVRDGGPWAPPGEVARADAPRACALCQQAIGKLVRGWRVSPHTAPILARLCLTCAARSESGVAE